MGVKGKTIRPRIRCPVCGRLAWMSQFQKNYGVDIIANVYIGGGRNKNWIKFIPITDVDRLQEAKHFLAERCFLVAQQLGIVMKNEQTLGYRMINTMPTTIPMRMEVDYGQRT